MLDADGAPAATVAAAARWIREPGDYYRRTATAAGWADLTTCRCGTADLLREHARSPAAPSPCSRRHALRRLLALKALAREPGCARSPPTPSPGACARLGPGTHPSRRCCRGRWATAFTATGDARERARTAERSRWLLRLGIAASAFPGDDGRGAVWTSTPCRRPRDFFRWLTFLLSTRWCSIRTAVPVGHVARTARATWV